MKYLFNLLVAIDQLGNALCGGNPENTISARVGYFSKVSPRWPIWYWKMCERLIDITFWPVHGPNHCFKIFEKNAKATYYDIDGDFLRVLLLFFILITCIPISIIFYTLWLISKPRQLLKRFYK